MQLCSKVSVHLLNMYLKKVTPFVIQTPHRLIYYCKRSEQKSRGERTVERICISTIHYIVWPTSGPWHGSENRKLEYFICLFKSALQHVPLCLKIKK